jgi:hypothetical protein
MSIRTLMERALIKEIKPIVDGYKAEGIEYINPREIEETVHQLIHKSDGLWEEFSRRAYEILNDIIGTISPATGSSPEIKWEHLERPFRHGEDAIENSADDDQVYYMDGTQEAVIEAVKEALSEGIAKWDSYNYYLTNDGFYIAVWKY